MDQMARYKYNVLHRHLSDDRAGASRSIVAATDQCRRPGALNDLIMVRVLPALANEKASDGGFYTQEEMREMIQYAKRTGILQFFLKSSGRP